MAGTGEDPVERRDLEALLATRQELGRRTTPRSWSRSPTGSSGRWRTRSARRVDSSAPPGADGAAPDDLPVRAGLGVDGGRDPDQHHARVTENYLALLIAWIGIVAVNVAHASTMRRDNR